MGHYKLLCVSMGLPGWEWCYHKKKKSLLTCNPLFVSCVCAYVNSCMSAYVCVSDYFSVGTIVDLQEL